MKSTRLAIGKSSSLKIEPKLPKKSVYINGLSQLYSLKENRPKQAFLNYF
jgi:hypothetical protein